MLPFGKEELDYISRLDAKADIRMLRTEVRANKQTAVRLRWSEREREREEAVWLDGHVLVWW